MKKLHKGTIKSVKQVAKGTVSLTFEPHADFTAVPGQFVSILCDGLTLRRPFSVADFDRRLITVLFKLKGKGTDYLASLKPGDEIDFIGAMGNGFNIKDKKALLIGAGIGIAPVFYLNKELKQRGIESLFAGAFMTKDEVPQGLELDEIITNDGTTGKKGSILDHLEQIVHDYKPEVIYACGPSIVLKAISKLDIPSQLALEKVMACGIGVCKGCVIKVRQGNEIVNNTICHDGPVFDGKEVVWE